MTKRQQEFVKYARSPIEESLLATLGKWEPHLKYEHLGKKWLVMSMADLQASGVVGSIDGIRKAIRRLKNRGIIEIIHRPRPSKKGNPASVCWIRFCRHQGPYAPSLTDATHSPPGTLPTVLPGPCKKENLKENLIENSKEKSQFFEEAKNATQETEEKMKQAGELPEILKGSNLTNGGIKLEPKKPKVKLTADGIYEDFQSSYLVCFGMHAPTYKVKFGPPLKKVLQLLANHKLTYDDWASICHTTFDNWAEFLKWSEDSLDVFTKKAQPDPAFISLYAPVMLSYWNMKKAGELSPGKGAAGDTDHVDDNGDFEFT